MHSAGLALGIALIAAAAQAQQLDRRLDVINVLGQEVAVVQRGPLAAGRTRLAYCAQTAPSGIHVVSFEAVSTRLPTKSVVLR